MGTTEGPITHPATGGILENARISVVGSPHEVLSDSGGFYRLDGVPAGTAQVRVFFSGFPLAMAAVSVAEGQTAQRDFELSLTASGARKTSAPSTDGSVVKLDDFVVATSREMSAAALAINEQRFAPNMKNVVATDEFGDVAEGNVAEFMKFLSSVNIDYAGGNARDISQNGVPSIYVPVTLDGFGLASAVGGGTSRGIGLDQVAINNLSRVEVSFSPTPDSQRT